MNGSSTASLDLAAQLRGIAINHIEEASLGDAEVSAKLGVAEQTAHSLLQRTRWDVNLAIRVIDQLGLSVTVDVR